MAASKSRGIFIAVLAVLLAGALGVWMYLGRSSASADGRNPGQPGGPGQQQQGQGQGGGGQQQGGPGGGNFGGGNFGQNQPPLVEVGQVTEGAIREQLALIGSLKPKEQVEVVSRITGRVQRVLVQVGDPVREGQLIAELEGDEVEQQVLRAEATLAVSQATIAQRQAELENAKADEARGAQLLAEGLVSVASQQSAATRARVVESQLRLAEAQLRQSQADLTELKIRQQQTRVLSPLTGWVGRRYVDPGALVNTNTTIVDVLLLASMVTEVKVPEEHVTRLRVGNRALVSVDAIAGEAFEGRVARIAPVLDAATRSGSVEVEIPNPSGALKAEMSARIQMEMGSERRAVLVPRDAVVIRGQLTGVNVLEGDRVRFQSIETGLSTDRGVEVLAGVNPGVTIVVKGSQGLQDGAVVQVQKKPPSAPGRPS